MAPQLLSPVGAGGDEFAGGAVREGLPTGGGLMEEFGEAAVDDGEFAGVGGDGDGGVGGAGAVGGGALVKDAAAQEEGVAGLEAAEGVGERFPRGVFGAGIGVVAAGGIDEEFWAGG